VSIQITAYEVTVKQNEDRTQGQVVLTVNFNGHVKERCDALLMILDAWDDSMKEAGFDPLKSHAAFQREGKMN